VRQDIIFTGSPDHLSGQKAGYAFSALIPIGNHPLCIGDIESVVEIIEYERKRYVIKIHIKNPLTRLPPQPLFLVSLA
jgi:hypothetical protein